MVLEDKTTARVYACWKVRQRAEWSAKEETPKNTLPCFEGCSPALLFQAHLAAMTRMKKTWCSKKKSSVVDGKIAPARQYFQRWGQRDWSRDLI